MKHTVVIKPETRQTYAALFLLQELKAKRHTDILLSGDDNYLEPLFEWLMSHQKLTIENNVYTLTPLGEKTLTLFRRRYTDFLRNFEVYSAVDLSAGNFAFEAYWRITDEAEWEAYLEREQWEDLRIAVCEYKGIDPVEIVFLSWVNEGRLREQTADTPGWQFDLMSGTLWDEAIEVISTALRAADLGYSTPDGKSINGTEVLLDILQQGAELNSVLWRTEDETLRQEDPLTLPTDAATYQRYRDPRYKDPAWDERFFD